jgi:hypothetical protein
MIASLDTSGLLEFESPRGEFDYRLLTPWRAIGSVALVFKKFGFISVDYEWVNYSGASFDFNKNFSFNDDFAETNVNNSIEAKYGSASNLRIGGEFKFNMFRFRGGYAYYGSPFKNKADAGDFDNVRQMLTSGLGIVGKSFYLDFAYVHRLTKEYDIQYVLDDPSAINEGAELDRNTGNIVMSAGFRF